MPRAKERAEDRTQGQRISRDQRLQQFSGSGPEIVIILSFRAKETKLLGLLLLLLFLFSTVSGSLFFSLPITEANLFGTRQNVSYAVNVLRCFLLMAIQKKTAL